jgi:hypothetical protein
VPDVNTRHVALDNRTVSKREQISLKIVIALDWWPWIGTSAKTNQELAIKLLEGRTVNLPFFGRTVGRAHITVRQLAEVKRAMTLLKGRGIHVEETCATLIFELEKDDVNNIIDEYCREFSLTRIDRFSGRTRQSLLWDVSDEFRYATSMFLMAANVAMPGCAEAKTPVIFINGQGSLASQTYFAGISSDLHDTLQKGNFGVSTSDPIEFWEWYRIQGGVMRGISTTSVARACCIVTRLYHSNLEEDHAIGLFWSMAGIEALLADGERGIVRQMIEKMSALRVISCDNSKEIDRLFRDAYKIRSGLIHGSRNMTNKFQPNIDPGYSDAYWKELATVSFAIKIFFALIRRAFELKASQFDFGYQLLAQE